MCSCRVSGRNCRNSHSENQGYLAMFRLQMRLKLWFRPKSRLKDHTHSPDDSFEILGFLSFPYQILRFFVRYSDNLFSKLGTGGLRQAGRGRLRHGSRCTSFRCIKILLALPCLLLKTNHTALLIYQVVHNCSDDSVSSPDWLWRSC